VSKAKYISLSEEKRKEIDRNPDKYEIID
jgi:hypothetical protein